MWLKRLLVGNPLRSAQAAQERLPKRLALAVFSSNALSSVAYATEEILLVLVVAATGALAWSVPISLMILLLLVFVTISYRQVIYEYPEGGGAYVVAKNNFGEIPGLTAAAVLMIDYVLTVAVSAAAGVAALTSALPALYPYRVSLGILAVLLLVILNLRGARQSGRIFAVPIYFAIGMIFLMLGTGFIQATFGNTVATGGLGAAGSLPALEGMSLFLLLRAFAGGCTAVTGVEVISNGVSAFEQPEAKNAAVTMTIMALILACLFLGITTLAFAFNIQPRAQETLFAAGPPHLQTADWRD